MLHKALSALAVCAALIGLGIPGGGRAEPGASSAGPSVPCTSPSEIEAVICKDPALSAADRRMATLYQAAKLGPLHNGSNQAGVQREWLKGRDAQCASGALKMGRTARDCVAGAYDERLESLAIADLLAEPQLSLAVLRDVDPEAEPYYEALLAYATIDNEAERTKVVEAKLAPLYAGMSPEVKQGIEYQGQEAATAHDAAASDDGFERFFDISAMRGDVRLVWPCAVLIKRPELVFGLNAFYGSSADSSVPDSDCEEVLPPSPAELKALADAASDAQPPCEGSIRFAYFRNYLALQDSLRLHLVEGWGRDGKASKEEMRFRRRQSALIARTGAALAAYYTHYFHVSRSDAATDGRAAADALISAAFDSCD
jgi:uncharacterized protein